MSGGVDSTTTAYLLKKQGYNIFGVTMSTCGKEDKDAKKACDTLGVPHYLLDVQEDFNKYVVTYFVDSYVIGDTPNPCVMCNRYIKFGKLLDFIFSKGGIYMATGHYANIINNKLSAGDDLQKDQVYFLGQCNKDKLKYIKFPIGDLEKTQVRELAKLLNIPVYNKKDSQEICFVEDGKLKEFLIEKSNGIIGKPGNIIDENGNILGTHHGLSFYTIGQRRGIGIAGDNPYYVIKLDGENNQIIVGDNDRVFKTHLIAKDINCFLNDINELNNLILYAKTRSRDDLHKCKVNLTKDNLLHVEFLEESVRAITPGQLLVLYDDTQSIIASGFII
ncbi:MAG: tRNA 2-thiouridine(34) synthase MnmA [Fusobacteriaceae bacterium]|nr:tRNA 2-thiouridine(34) synthase MnmA [Fusobacteriaceae bacterium]